MKVRELGHEEVLIDLILGDSYIAERLCRHCKRSVIEHTTDKCLFEATLFLPEDGLTRYALRFTPAEKKALHRLIRRAQLRSFPKARTGETSLT